MKISSLCPGANYLPCSIQTSRLRVIVTHRYSSSDMLESHRYFISKIVVGKLDIVGEKTYKRSHRLALVAHKV